MSYCIRCGERALIPLYCSRNCRNAYRRYLPKIDPKGAKILPIEAEIPPAHKPNYSYTDFQKRMAKRGVKLPNQGKLYVI